VTGEQFRALAEAVLAREDVRLAVAVREGGPHAVRRAVELAAMVLATDTQRRNTADS
jgi:hypothetical protein